MEGTPELAYGAQRLRPLFFIESHFTCADSCKGFELIDNIQTVKPLHTSVDIGRKSEQLWSVNLWHLIYNDIEISHLL